MITDLLLLFLFTESKKIICNFFFFFFSVPDASLEDALKVTSILVRSCTVEEGNFEHLFNFEANLKICQIFFHHFFLA
jgi:hypothetical protein